MGVLSICEDKEFRDAEASGYPEIAEVSGRNHTNALKA